jgi:predicted metal-dependent enzyme (double-stranded beta helix superfamily)
VSVHVLQPAVLHHLRSLADLRPEAALREAPPLLAALLQSTNLLDDLPSIDGHCPTLIPLEDMSGGITLQLFLWPAGSWTPIHDHTSWGIYACLAGILLEDRYERLDAESQPDEAHLRREWRAIWRPGQQSRLMPYNGGIHRVANASLGPAASLHLYGPPMSAIDGRTYDPATAIVCDRPREPAHVSLARAAA